MLRIRSTAGITLALLVASPAQAQVARLERQVLAMGTTLHLDLSGPSDDQLQGASETAFREVERIEQGISTWRNDSAFSRLNQARGTSIPLAAEWLRLLEATRLQALRTGGAFDPMLGSLTQVWGLRGGGSTPSRAALAQARRSAGSHLLKLDEPRGAAQLLQASAGIEEGGFGKGYALDQLALRLQEAGATAGLLDFGGQLLAFGGARSVAIADPKDRAKPRLTLKLNQASLSSSGTSEKGGHILDPRSGRPSPTWGSVAVVDPSGLVADCLSTALFVMGPRRGLRWANLHHVPACFLLNDGSLRLSSAFRALAPSIL